MGQLLLCRQPQILIIVEAGGGGAFIVLPLAKVRDEGRKQVEDTDCDSWDSGQQPVFSPSSIPNLGGQSRWIDCSPIPIALGPIGRLPSPLPEQQHHIGPHPHTAHPFSMQHLVPSRDLEG